MICRGGVEGGARRGRGWSPRTGRRAGRYPVIMAIKVLVADKFEKQGVEGLAGLGCQVVLMPDVGAEKLPAAIGEQDPQVVVVRSTKVGKAAFEAGRSLKAVIRAGAGYDTVDLGAAKAKGVAVCNTPGMNSVAVAELTFAFLLALDRRVVEQTNELRAGVWNKKEYSKARGIKGLTLGLIGVGAIGREVIKRAKAFGMSCWAHSLNMTPDRALDLGVQYGGKTRDELYAMLGKCDVVSVHVAANQESQKMCDAKFFGAMKSGAIFLNTSRGSVVDEAALIDAMKNRGLRAGLDVFENEPAGGAAQWKWTGADLPGLVGAHHVGASTDQAQQAVAEEVVRIVKVFRDGGGWENRVG